MYPNLTPPLLALLGVALLATALVALRQPLLRRLALRQARRRGEALLVIAGAALGTAIIVGSLVVGDTFGFSVKRDADRQLGPIDELVSASAPAQGEVATKRVAALRGDPDVDGILTLRIDRAAVAKGDGAGRRAEPNATVAETDFAAAARFGGSQGQGGVAGLGGPAPGPGEVVLNDQLAGALGAHVGDTVTCWLYGHATPLRVIRVVPATGAASGLADAGDLGSPRRAAFLAPGTLAALAPKNAEPKLVTYVSNTGGTEGGNARSDAVEAKLTQALGPLAAGTDAAVTVDKVKQQALSDAKSAGDQFGSFFLFVGSFSLIAGVMLLVNVFVMLAEERKGELGILRAIGMRRGRLVRAFMLEGALYALLASGAGALAGIGVGRAVSLIAGRIFASFAGDQGGLAIVFHLTPVSLVSGAALGFLIAFLTVTLTAVRISRRNVIAAIRDLPDDGAGRLKRRWVAVATLVAAGLGGLTVPAVVKSQGALVYLLPALTALALYPLLVRLLPRRLASSLAALAVLGWALAANTVRPHLFDDGSTGTYVTLGVVLTFSAVLLLSQNQQLVTWPLRPLTSRATPSGLAARLAFAYPLARRFRTGAILVMYALVVFTLVLVAVLISVEGSTKEHQIASATGGFAIRADLNPSAPSPGQAAFTAGRLAGRVAAAVPLYGAEGRIPPAAGQRPGDQPAQGRAAVVGADPRIAEAGLFPLDARLAGLGDDRATWRAVLRDPRYVITTNWLLGGKGDTKPGDSFTLTNPRTGRAERKTVAGVLRNPEAFFGPTTIGPPVIMGVTAARAQFGGELRLNAVLVKAAPGVSDQALAAELQGAFLPQGLVATRIRQQVEQEFAAGTSFDELLEGFLALGLLVGIGGLGVVMVRAVRERRRQIGVLRALGFQARVIGRAWISESAFVAAEGILLGAALAITTDYLLFRNDPDVKAAQVPFSIPWLSLTVLLSLTAAASLLATAWPARQAARLQPAVALRIAV